MDGRKLLVFSDNRQDAAFFAPNFERTSRDIALRTAICRVAARREGEPIGLHGLTDEVYEVLTAGGARPRASSGTRLRASHSTGCVRKRSWPAASWRSSAAPRGGGSPSSRWGW
jgi:hypothetical protein